MTTPEENHATVPLAQEAESQSANGDWDWLFEKESAGPMMPSPSPGGDVRRRNGAQHTIEGADGGVDDDDEEGDPDESVPEPITLPESTHTLLFTQPATSVPFAFAVAIAIVCYTCFVMALVNNLQSDSDVKNTVYRVPANVSMSVRTAQYLSILIALIMEEEIPTGLQLLRILPDPSSFRRRFPNRVYGRVVASAMLRIALGYLFLINVFVILAQAEDVLEIFYNLMALEFISKLADMSFALAKMDVFGKRMRRACTARLFHLEFEKVKVKYGKRARAGLFQKSVYFVNMTVFLVLLTLLSIKQKSGGFQCKKISVDFGDGVWENPIIVGLPPSMADKNYTLVFSYFNGVYEQDGTHRGRPVYKERRKFDNGPFDPSWQLVPAEIRYSNLGEFWVFTHPWIRKSRTAEDDDDPWLLRSPSTNEYDLLQVDGEWSIWLGRTEKSQLQYDCYLCNNNADCNLNGECNTEGMCDCKSVDGTKYLGTHCEVKVEDESCGTITTENMNVSFSMQYFSSDGSGQPKRFFHGYNRPIYTHIQGMPGVEEGDIFWLCYTGRKWFGIKVNLVEMNTTLEGLMAMSVNFHDSTTRDSPVGVDFYRIGERGNQFGPFGALYPLQKYNQTGRGIWRCSGPPTAPDL
ncbi:hypothetical protein ACHAW5_002037 [Stephanodiscus triporus]|uniref:EGF-like domain-containing protein n=1 Tax=Stephanodiscus triporus TaxID=2934178 RepID=A0ABD3QMV6_9STRA